MVDYFKTLHEFNEFFFFKLDIEIECIIQYMLSHNSIEQEFIKCKYQIIINDNDSVDRKGSIISIFTSEPSLLKILLP